MESLAVQIRNGRASYREMQRTHGVPIATLAYYVKSPPANVKRHGGQTVFSSQQELTIINCILKCADWGFPLEKSDVRHYAKRVLDDIGITIQKFNDNLPGKDWINGLLKRHHKDKLSARICNNMSRARGKLSEAVINSYFENLELALEGVPPENIFNYDETGMVDDPGRSVVLVRRGAKFPYRIMHSSKTSHSVIFCGDAAGTYLAHFIVYRHSGEPPVSWKAKGPKGNRICSNRCCKAGLQISGSPRGWFITEEFENCFFCVFFPHAKELEGPKVMIGDNLSSHFSNKVIHACEEHNIRFICLPPNATHLLQPLDFCVFRPLKGRWREILKVHKRGNNRSVPKSDFPTMLRTLINEDAERMSHNLAQDFTSTGIVPLDKNVALKRIPRAEIPEDTGPYLETSTGQLSSSRRPSG